MNFDEIKKVPLESVMTVSQMVELTGISRQNLFGNYIEKNKLDIFSLDNTKNSRSTTLLVCNQKLLDMITLIHLNKKVSSTTDEHVVDIVELIKEKFKFIKS